MTRLETLNKITELEKRKTNIDNLCKDLNSPYTQSVTINANLGLNEFHQKYKDEEISLPINELEYFLRTQSTSLENQIKQLIDKLS